MTRPLSLVLLLAATLLPAGPAGATAFRDCVEGLGERAAAAGVDRDLIARVLPSLSPLERVIALDRSQPEFVQTFPAYLEARVTASRVDKGRALLERHGAFLESLLARYGVPPRYLVAFWGLETNYGGYLGKVPTLDSLATLACDERRSEFFAGEFVNALQLVEREQLPVEQLVGSWAGAVGHTQFMPSSYLRYAVDGDGDGRIDLWQSEQDALASGANFLRSLGWKPGMRWGRQVGLPAGFAYEQAGLGKAQSLRAWAAAGVTRADGAPLPALDLEAALLLPAGHRGPAFLVYDNFRVVMRWNASQSYALAVGLLADQLAGAPPLRLPPGLAEPLRKADIVGAQEALNALGLDAGTADGIIGSRTRAALRAFQLDAGLPADGYPDPDTLEALERHALP